MTLKGSNSITVTLLKTTVEKLRAIKHTETWDELMLRLATQKCGIECITCGKRLDMDDLEMSRSQLAKIKGWDAVKAGNMRIGFICPECEQERKK